MISKKLPFVHRLFFNRKKYLYTDNRPTGDYVYMEVQVRERSKNKTFLSFDLKKIDFLSVSSWAFNIIVWNEIA